MKNNMSKTVIKTIRTEVRRAFGNEYKYELIQSEADIPLYSIKIELKMITGSITKAESHGLIFDEGEAKMFFELLVDNLVTPINLPYVIEDELP